MATKKKILREVEAHGPSSRITPDGSSEAENMERRLRQVVSKKGIDGVSICIEKTPLSAETIFVDSNDSDSNQVLDKDFYALIVPGMSGTFDFYLYESEREAIGGSKSKPMSIDHGLTADELEARVLEFISSYGEVLSTTEPVPAGVSGGTKAGMGVAEGRKAILRETYYKQLVKTTFAQRSKSLKESFERLTKILG